MQRHSRLIAETAAGTSPGVRSKSQSVSVIRAVVLSRRCSSGLTLVIVHKQKNRSLRAASGFFGVSVEPKTLRCRSSLDANKHHNSGSSRNTVIAREIGRAHV